MCVCVCVRVGCLRILFINSRGPVSLVIFTVYAHPSTHARTLQTESFFQILRTKNPCSADVFVVLAAAAAVEHH